ncbi:MAG TPA: siroheme synthase CysG [Woeseiaceae bacterium]|nr:siroheme synthase CysG [Woeseiaceae bacterium]
MDYLPIFVKLEQQPCLIVGGGAVAGRKAALLLRAGARVSIVAPELVDSLRRLYEQKQVVHIRSVFRSEHVTGRRLVIAATDDAQVNSIVSRAAEAAGVPCNVVDNTTESSFILPAIVDRSPVTIAIGTGGNAPVLAQRLKSKIEAWLPARIGELAKRAGRWRGPVSKRFSSMQERRRFWQRFFDGPVAEHILANRVAEAERLVRQELIGGITTKTEIEGEAYIVGAGPGDPGLLTLRAQQLLSQADVILYDRLVAEPILDFARKEAELVSVGKTVGESRVQQETINRMLVNLVRQGKRVCRLKGGDPFIFGRGGEEAAALKAAGLPYQVVPGISAALGCASYAGIPLTMRGMSGSVTFATAKLDGGRSADWQALARPGQTLVLYMSAGSVGESATELMQHGLAGRTPAAVVESGTTVRQRVLHSTLGQVTEDARAAGIRAPALLFIGESVALGQNLAWFAESCGNTASHAHPAFAEL